MKARRRGAAAIEFALVVPVLLLLLAGVIEWGWYLSREVAVIQAVREGALTGTLTREEDDPVTAGTARLRDVLATTGFDAAGASCSGALTDTSIGRTITLQTSLRYVGLIPFIPTPTTLGAALTMRLVDQ